MTKHRNDTKTGKSDKPHGDQMGSRQSLLLDTTKQARETHLKHAYRTHRKGKGKVLTTVLKETLE